MALDENIAMKLYDRLLQVITGADPSTGLPSAFDTKETMFVMAQRGMVLKGEDYYNPYTPGNLEGSREHAQNMASLVDDIPALNPVLSSTNRQVSTVYSDMVRFVHVTEPLPSPDIQAARDRNNAILWTTGKDDEGRSIPIPTILASRENTAFSAYQDAYLAYIATWQAAEADPNLKKIWPIIGPTALAKVKRAFADWGAAGRDQIESANAQLATLNEGQVARCFADAQFKLKAYELVNGTDTFLRSKISPTDWASNAGSWPGFSFKQTDYETGHSSEATSWGASAGFGLGLWSFGGDVSHSASHDHLSVESTNIGISFKWRICPIYRPWLDATLFKLPNWDDGTFAGPGNIGGGPDPLMPLIPIAVVIVRNIEITGTWAKRDSDHIKEATSGKVSAGWGPFAVSGNYSNTSTKDTFSAHETAQGFFIPDITVLGWVCSKTPFSPPHEKQF